VVALGFGEEDSYVAPPSRIELLSERLTKGFGRDGFLLRTTLKSVVSQPGSRESSYWQARSPNQIDLIWTDGFTGVRVKLEKNGNDLSGWARPHFDMVKLIPRTAHVTAHRISCDLY
jgi:hypothetical protein